MSERKFIDLLYECGNLTGCHQMVERSFFYNGYQFPICARCTGVFIGHIIFFLFFFAKEEIRLIYYLLFSLIMFIDWFMQFLEIKSSTNRRRLITGILGGWGLFGVYYKLMVYLVENIPLNIGNTLQP